jgi:SAM-dependent methyltransferase
LHLAPIKPHPQNVLDFGTGTGIWAIEFAEEYPSASVLGTDLSPIQPLQFVFFSLLWLFGLLLNFASVPPNCRFEIDDAEDEWVYTEKFDYIHGRLLAVCFNDPAAVFRRAFHSCAPGGYFEMFDFASRFGCIDESLSGTALENFAEMMIEGTRLLGKDVTHVIKYKDYMEAAGFVDIVEEKFQWPINTWPKGSYYKTLGLWYNQDLQEGLSGMAMAICTRGLKMSREQVELLLVNVRKDLKNTKIHAYLPM